MTSLVLAERPAGGEPVGLLVLHHGRGADERDLAGLADVLDPGRRLHVVSPRAPLTLPGWSGYHWYIVHRVGHPDRDSFWSSFEELGALHDELWERTGLGPERTVLGGFSMGAVMSYSLGLPAGRPAPAGILAFSGFLPDVEGWRPEPETRVGTRIFISHGRSDPIIGVHFGREAGERLARDGLEVDYQETEAAHHIDPAVVPHAVSWLEAVL